MAQFTHDFMKALDISKASLIGASAGGGVALTLLTRNVSFLCAIAHFGGKKAL
jgi:pimeloyl-ACP methyl ester carboxylesterase